MVALNARALPVPGYGPRKAGANLFDNFRRRQAKRSNREEFKSAVRFHAVIQAWESSEMSEKVSEKVMSSARLIRQVAEPRPVGDSVKQAINRAARRLGWSFNRAKDVWYDDARIKISADEFAQLQAKARHKEADDDKIAGLVSRLERLEAAMLQTDPEFYGEYVSAARFVRAKVGNENQG